jgi:hypothetical protein
MIEPEIAFCDLQVWCKCVCVRAHLDSLEGRLVLCVCVCVCVCARARACAWICVRVDFLQELSRP